jgi:hypothetical protein
MSNRYLDEAGKVTSKHIDTTIKDRTDALGFFKLMGIKEITTSRQKKNGTTVYELPLRRLSYTGNSRTYKYAIYDSGYIRDVSDYNHSPWYINKRYQTKTKYWNSYYKEYGNYTGFKPVFVNNFDDQLVYLANYILKNRYRNNKVYSCCDFNIEQIKETCDFRHKAKWEGDTVTITRDEYVRLKSIDPLVRTQDDIQVIINGTRYNLS